MKTMKTQPVKLLKCIIWLAACIPLGRLVWLGLHDDLSANPIEFIERSTGTWALVFLLICLSITPIRLMTNHAWLIQVRRLLGLWMFAYASLHVITYVWLDFSFVLSDMVKDVAKHPRIFVGFVAYMLTIPLAVTSNSYAIKRLKSNWKKLHQLVYVVAILAVIHFLWLVKKDITEPLYYAVLLVILFSIRIYFNYKKNLKFA